ncbi:2OG-Fe(II) oxygenase [Sphingomonas sp. BN140010]|uniref:2OG-Fe(II) oxygenase n=1 Tax=Sphingomonas arvum TaxID=2992113 RepID=A0ABT3JEP2_9SPHN|nr:2OG-Fe(II) oxygenase [Sphingomonas sp. BN140010]MCW3797518.1 2OG-Fe(II) oxygenase [Sphingomonas sp. BN140010]
MRDLVNPAALADLQSLADRFASARPFPHVAIDNFLLPAVAGRLHDEVRATGAHVDANNQITQKLKFACTDWDRFGDLTYRLIAYFNSAAFVGPLEAITGIGGLLVDPWLEGGGIHLTSRGGYLKMHTDFNWNAKLRADRRVNILLYLNKGWQPDWRGELVIAREDEAAHASIEPLFNRLVVFNTNDTTLHGHPHPLQFPADYPRASIAMYYYSTGLEVSEKRRMRATTTRYIPLNKGDIDLTKGSIRARIGYLLRRFTRL